MAAVEEQQTTESGERLGSIDPALSMRLTIVTLLIGIPVSLFSGGVLLVNISVCAALALIVWRHGPDVVRPIIALREPLREAVALVPRRKEVREQREEALPQLTEEKSATTMTRKLEDDEVPLETPAPSTTATVKLNDQGSRDELLRLGTIVETREPLVAHANRFFGKGILVSGMPECGKSNLAALLIEQMGGCYIPSVIFDYKQEYASLIGVVPNGIQAGYGLSGPGYYNLTVENAAEFAADVMENGFQAVVDLQSYATLNDMAMVMAAVVNGLLAWSKAQPDHERTPCFVFEDEAHLFFPQQQSFTTLSKEVANMLGQSHFQLVTIGRSYGYTPAFFTQRLANIVKWLIATCQIKIIMRHSADVDLDRCMEEVKDSVATREMIENMPQGQGVVSGLGDRQFVAHFAERKSYHASHTPDIKRAHQRYRDSGNSRSKTAFLPEMEDLRQNPLWNIPRPTPVEKMVTTGTVAISQRPMPKLAPELQMVLNVYKPGMSHRAIEHELLKQGIEISHVTAGKHLQRLKDLRIIDANGNLLVNR